MITNIIRWLLRSGRGQIKYQKAPFLAQFNKIDEMLSFVRNCIKDFLYYLEYCLKYIWIILFSNADYQILQVFLCFTQTCINIDSTYWNNAQDDISTACQIKRDLKRYLNESCYICLPSCQKIRFKSHLVNRCKHLSINT